MEQKSPTEAQEPKMNLLVELAKKKALAQAQNKTHAFGHFTKTNERPRSHSWPAVFGGRNGQGKP